MTQPVEGDIYLLLFRQFCKFLRDQLGCSHTAVICREDIGVTIQATSQPETLLSLTRLVLLEIINSYRGQRDSAIS